MQSRRVSYFQYSRLLAMWLIASSAAFLGSAGFSRAQATVLYSFTDNTDGASPAADLVFDTEGNLYGTTTGGTTTSGSATGGVVFQLSPKKVETVLHTFAGAPSDGSNPLAGLIFGTDGALYGTTQQGGTAGCGIVFQLTPPTPPAPAWGYKVLHSFQNGNDGCRPQGDLIFDSNGVLYGSTAAGGTNGTVFMLAPPVPPATAWAETVLYFFKGGPGDGQNPLGHLTFDTSGALYGTTELGGSSKLGTVFQLAPPVPPATNWTETVLYSFAGGNDGAKPQAGLAIDSKGALYGTTSNGGGSSNFGTVFQLTPPTPPATTWKETVLHSFKGPRTDGAYPFADVILDSKGNLYGTTSAGGSCLCGDGTVFKLTATTWKETVLHNFIGSPTDGNQPLAGLIFNSKGTLLYGTTYQGGKSHWGTVFEQTP